MGVPRTGEPLRERPEPDPPSVQADVRLYPDRRRRVVRISDLEEHAATPTTGGLSAMRSEWLRVFWSHRFDLSLGGWNACRTLQDNIMLNNKLSQLSRG